jgi:DNA modification methylase
MIRKKECVFALGEVPKIDLPEIQLRYSTTKKIFSQRITKSSDAEKLLRKIIPAEEIELREQVVIFYLNNYNKVIGYYRHSTGGINQTIIDNRLILAAALKSLSVGIILCHNHPSGNKEPSASDKTITNRLKNAAAQMDIALLDHIILTKESCYSFSDEGILSLNGISDKCVTKTAPYKIIHGDVLAELKKLPSASIDCVVTSPPSWQLRDYGFKNQWGLEKNFKEYLSHLWEMMDELHRVLKPKGTVWVNLGDTYFGSGNGSGQDPKADNNLRKSIGISIAPSKPNADKSNGMRKKCQMLIPHRFAIGCIDRGWIVRNDIVWAKPNGLPESTRDRFTKKHEYIFLLVKQADYFFDLDAVRDAHKENSKERTKYKMTAFGGDLKNNKGAFGKGAKNGGALKTIKLNPLGKNPGDVSDFWAITTKRGNAGHYATFNTELIEKPILAGCPENGVVLDPFCGSGTTGVKALELNRRFIGIDGKKEYCDIARKNFAQIKNKSGENIQSLIMNLSQLKFKKAA